LDPDIEVRGLRTGTGVISTGVCGVDVVLHDGLNHKKCQLHSAGDGDGSRILTAQNIAAAPVMKPNAILLSGVKLIPRRRRPGYTWVDTVSEKRARISDLEGLTKRSQIGMKMIRVNGSRLDNTSFGKP
jgi:hypothetical protein